MMKRLLSMLLVLTMLFSLAPITLASGEIEEESVIASEPEPAEEPAPEPFEEAPAEESEPMPAPDGFPYYIDDVAVTGFVTPVAGEKPCTASQLSVPNDARYKVTDVQWHEDDAGKFSGNAFRAGHTYYATIVLSAVGTDYTFWNTGHTGLDQFNSVTLNGSQMLIYKADCFVTLNYSSNLYELWLETVSFGVDDPKSGDILSVELSIAQPVAENHPSFDVTYNSAKYKINPEDISWSETTSDAGVSSSSVFESGKNYTLTVILTAESGYDFKDSSYYASGYYPVYDYTFAKVNGQYVSAWKTKDDPKRLVVSAGFTPLEYNDRVDFSSLTTELTPGMPAAADGKLASGSHCSIFSQKWTLLGQSAAYSGNVVPGKTYFYDVYFEPDAGYSFGDVGTEVPVYLNGTKLGVGTVQLIAGTPMVDFVLECTIPVQKLTSASVTVTTPTAGASVTLADGVVPADAHYTIAEQYWCNSTSSSSRLLVGSFANGKTYYYYVLLKPDEGYIFKTPSDVNASANGTAGTTKHTYSGTVGGEDRTGWFYMYVPFTAEGDTYSGPVVLTGLTMPAAGAAAKADASVSGTTYSITVQGWGEDIFLTKPVTSFEVGGAYYYTCRVTLAGDTVFKSGYNGPVTVNGETVEQNDFAAFYGAVSAGQESSYYNVDNGVISIILYRKASESAVLLGDVNGDGNVNPADRAALARYLAKWPNYQNINLANADVNGDGNVNPADRAYLARHFAKWPAYATLGVPVS